MYKLLVFLELVTVKYVRVDRTGVNAYSMRIKLQQTQNTAWILRLQLYKMRGLYRKSCLITGYQIVKAQVRDQRYNSGNLYPNRIIRHVLTKWIDHPPGVCGWGARMALKGLGIRKCVSSGLAPCMFNIRCISITFCCSLVMCHHRISLGICPCISA